MTDRYRDKTKRAVVTSKSFRMSEQELEQRLQELKAYKLAPSGGTRARLVLARGERLFEQLLGEERRKAAEVIQWLQRVLAEQNDQQITRSLREAEKIFDRLEGIEPSDKGE